MTDDLTVLRQAIGERGGSYVALIGAAHNGEMYRLARLGPYPDGPSAQRAADTYTIDVDATLEAIASGTLKPLNHVPDPTPDPDTKEQPPVLPVSPTTESGEDGAGATEQVGATGPNPAPAEPWQEQVKRAFANLDRAEHDKATASRQRDSIVTDAYLAGATYRAIADTAGVQHQTISHMVKREQKRRAEEGTPADGDHTARTDHDEQPAGD